MVFSCPYLGDGSCPCPIYTQVRYLTYTQYVLIVEIETSMSMVLMFLCIYYLYMKLLDCKQYLSSFENLVSVLSEWALLKA